jgi:hypothetical protein
MQNGGLEKHMAKHLPDHKKTKKHAYALTVPIHLRVEDRYERQGAKQSYCLNDEIKGIAKEKRVSAPRHLAEEPIDNKQF